MLPRAEEIQRALAGCFAVLRREPDAMDYFGDDAGAFLRSFFAAVLVLPLMILKGVAAGFPETAEAMPQVSLLAALLLYLVSWLLWPAVADLVAGVLDRSNRQYFRYIAAYNWSQLPIAALVLLTAIIAPPLAIVALGLSLLYLAFLAHEALEIPMPMAAGLVVLDFGLGLVLQFAVLGLSGGTGT